MKVNSGFYLFYKVSWLFKTVTDYERHIATLARYRDEGRIEIILERDLRRSPGSIVITR